MSDHDDPERIAEALVRRRSYATRLAANRKSGGPLSPERRKVATTAKLWRSKNRSRVKGYQSVYDKPHSALKREDVSSVSQALGQAARARDLSMDAQRRKAELDAAFDELRARTKGWVDEGWDRAKIVSEIDPNFIHHMEHYDRLLHGGDHQNGKKYPGGGGLRWGGLYVSESEALLRVMGSFEYKPQQEVYQQTIRFANYRRISEAEGFTWQEKARMLLTRDSLRVHCDCPAFKFYHNRAATVKGFALIPEDRDAPVNNPSDRSGICKHLDLVLRYIGAQHARMATEMRNFYEGREP